jgi:hypothetical protein
VPGGVLSATAPNVVDLTGLVGVGAPYSITYADGFDLAYQRSYAAQGGSLAFPAGASGALVSGFAANAVRLVEVSNPTRPRVVAGAALEGPTAGVYQLRFTPPAPGRFFATTALFSPEGLRPWTRADLRGADLLIVAPESMREGAERLAGMRQSSGLATAVISTEEIADTFGGGVATPRAIRAAVLAEWLASSGRLGYLALLGGGTIDYRDLLGFGGNLVPLSMASRPQGLFAADATYGDLNGDHVPDVAVGRVPARNEAELDAYLDKLASYEANPSPTWADRAVLLADAPDGGADFATDESRIAGLLASPILIDTGALGSTEARARLLGAWNAGAGVVSYYGHGALDRLSASGLLTSADVAGASPALANGSRLPLLTAMTCTINRLGVVGPSGVFSSLGEELVRASGRGAAAVLAPSGLAAHDDSARLAELFYRRLASRGDQSIGDIYRRACVDYGRAAADADGALDPTLPDLYVLLGDPSMKLLAAPPAPPSSGGAPGE